MKPTYITPMFKQYTRQIRSERYPVLNMIFGKILETGDIGIPCPEIGVSTTNSGQMSI